MDSKSNLDEVYKQIISKEKIQNQIIFSLIIVLMIFVLNVLSFSFTRIAIDKVRYALTNNIDFVSVYKGFTTSAIIVQPNPLSNQIIRFVAQITGQNDPLVSNNTGDFTINDSQLSDGISKIKGGIIDNIDELDELMNALPVNGVITESYGERINPLSNISELHEAVDISAEEGTPIKAFNSGTVINVGWSEKSGSYFFIKGEDGMESFYAHCLDIYVVDGDTVTKNDIVATVGSTGMTTGSHLHFEIIIDNERVDPIEFINNSNNE